MELNNKILKLRKQNGLSQEQLAEKIGVARQTISKWELGETSPDLNQAKNLSLLFNISLDELVGNDINNIIIKKISNTERLAGIIINILKVLGIILIISLIILIVVFFSRKYYEVKPEYLVSDSYGVYCYINDKREYFEASTTREYPDKIEMFSTNEEVLKEMNIDLSEYKSKEQLIKDVKKYIVSHGGTCK